MQTYTHLLMGAAAGAVLYPGNLKAQGAIIVGSVLPDLTMIPSYIMDVLKGRIPMAQQGKGTVLAKEIGHSILITLPLFLLSNGSVKALFLGILLHIVIDILTHGDIGKADQTFVWPLQRWLSNPAKIFAVWDYRRGPGILIPKPFEIGFCIICIGFWMFYFFR